MNGGKINEIIDNFAKFDVN